MDGREAERWPRELRGWVKRAKAVIARTERLGDLLTSGRGRAIPFYARFGLTEGQVRHGAAATDPVDAGLADWVPSPIDWMAEARRRAEACSREPRQVTGGPGCKGVRGFRRIKTTMTTAATITTMTIAITA